MEVQLTVKGWLVELPGWKEVGLLWAAEKLADSPWATELGERTASAMEAQVVREAV
jgi:hypothetical protein